MLCSKDDQHSLALPLDVPGEPGRSDAAATERKAARLGNSKPFLYSLAALCTFLCAASEPRASTSPGVPRPKPLQTDQATLLAEPVRLQYGMTTDFDALVGMTEYHTGFLLWCEGAPGITVTLVHENPSFTPPWTQLYIQCGSNYWESFTFTPSEAGLAFDTVTLSSDLGTVRFSLIGNGIPQVPAESWLADLGDGSSASHLVYDRWRDLIYVSDWGNDQVIVFSPTQQAVVTRVNVGLDPMGLSIAPDGRQLYVANSGELSISVVDLATWSESEIEISTLWPNPVEPYQFWYTPYAIAVVSDTLALLGSLPPGSASGGPLYQFDIESQQVSPRTDLPYGGVGRCPVFRTSYDYGATGIVIEPGSSPTPLARYSTPHNQFVEVLYRMERTTAVNSNGTRVLTANHDCNTLEPNLSVLDEEMRLVHSIQLVGCQSTALAVNPAMPSLVYDVPGRLDTGQLNEASLLLGRQTRLLTWDLPHEYSPGTGALALSDDGIWAYTLLVQTWCAPPTKLLAIRIGPTTFDDRVAPVSSMVPLAATQEHNWWSVSWSGLDEGSGIDHYEIEVRAGEAGSWTHWLTTPSTGALFTGATAGQRYDFRVIAFDRAGNIELYPEGWDTTTIAGSDTSGLSNIYLPLVSRR